MQEKQGSDSYFFLLFSFGMRNQPCADLKYLDKTVLFLLNFCCHKELYKDLDFLYTPEVDTLEVSCDMRLNCVLEHVL